MHGAEGQSLPWSQRVQRAPKLEERKRKSGARMVIFGMPSIIEQRRPQRLLGRAEMVKQLPLEHTEVPGDARVAVDALERLPCVQEATVSIALVDVIERG